MSEKPTTTLAAALVALQAEMPEIAKGRTATVTSQKGSYKYTYAGLDDVARVLQPLLAEHDLGFTSLPTIDDAGRFVLAYHLVHVNGERLSGSYPLPPNASPQATGSAITYARRYAMCAILGAVATEDDDGQAAAVAVPEPRQSSSRSWADDARPARVQDASRTQRPVDDEGPRPQSEPQRKKLMALFGQIGLSSAKDRNERLRLCSVWVGRDISSTSELSFVETARVISALEARIAEPPAGADEVPA